MESFKTPGFGWALDDKRKVAVIEGGLVEKVGFDSSFPVEFANKEFQTHLEEVTFHRRIRSALDACLKEKTDDIMNELKRSGTSSGRKLKWDIMKIRPNTSFRLHAHPNVEVIYVLNGSIHELRYQGVSIKDDYTPVDIEGPNMSNFTSTTGQFLHQVTRASSSPDDTTSTEGILINEIGSIHLSYTQEDGAVLLVLWSGNHANISDEHYPAPEYLPSIPDTGENATGNYSIKPGDYSDPHQNVVHRNIQEILRGSGDYKWDKTDQVSYGKNSNFGPHNWNPGNVKLNKKSK